MIGKTGFVVLGFSIAACANSGSGPGPVDLKDTVVTAVSLSTDSVELDALGATAQLTATATNASGEPVPGATVTWSSNQTSVASVSQRGLVTAAGNGTAGVTASAGDVNATAGIVVSQRVASISVTVDDDVLVGSGAPFTASATALDPRQNPVAGTTFTWSASDTSVVTVAQDGTGASVGHGNAVVRASAGGLTRGADIRVVGASGVAPDGVDQRIADFLVKWNVPGGSFAVVMNNRLVMARGYGLADIDSGTAVEPGSLFRIASISKPITGVATLKLIEDGLLSLDDTVFVNVLPDFVPGGGPVDPRILNITIDELLHHTAGWDLTLVPDPMFRQRQIAQDMGVPSPPDAETIVRWLMTQPMQFDPGARFSYHNLNYLILGRVIERASGMPYEDYVKTTIFAPLGITTARIGSSRIEQRAPGEVKYYPEASGLVPSVFDGVNGNVSRAYGGFGDIVPMDSHGGWIVSAVDLLRFALAVDGDPTVPDIISASSQSYMVSNPGFGYGAGWFLNTGNFNHSGGLPGTATVLWIRTSGVMIAAELNADRQSQSSTYFGEFIGGFLNAVDAETSWPAGDLFDQY